MLTRIDVSLDLRDEDVQGLLDLGVDVNTPNGVAAVRGIVLRSLLNKIRPDLGTESPAGEAFTQKAIHHLMPK